MLLIMNMKWKLILGPQSKIINKLIIQVYQHKIQITFLTHQIYPLNMKNQKYQSKTKNLLFLQSLHLQQHQKRRQSEEIKMMIMKWLEFL